MAKKRKKTETYGTRPGVGVDSEGGQVIDPTKNVEALVKALEEALEKLRQADARRLDDLRTADLKRADDLRSAEQRHLDAIAVLKQSYDRQIFDIQTVQVKTTSDLISAQLSKETGSLANQINAATLQTQGLISTLSARIDKLEQSRYEISGKSSVADPQLAAALAQMATSIQALTTSGTKTETRRENTTGMFALAVGSSAIISAIITFAGFAIIHAK
jgi:hypothetical protein